MTDYQRSCLKHKYVPAAVVEDQSFTDWLNKPWLSKPQKLLDKQQPGDEIWFWDNDAWDRMCGRCGWVLLRNDEIVEWEMIAGN